MKVLIETTGDFQLLDYNQARGLVIRADRPTVSEQNEFVHSRAAIGQIKVLGQINDEATNEEFDGYWKDSGDRELAISAFLDSFLVAKEEKKEAAAPKVAKPQAAK